MSLSVLSVIQSVFQPVHQTNSNHLQQLPTRISQSARRTTARTINEMSAAQAAVTANDATWRSKMRKSNWIKKGRVWYKITTKTTYRKQISMTEVAHARYPPYTPTSDNVPPNAPKQQVRLFGGWSGHQIQQYKRTYGHSQQANNSGGLQKSS